jgi:hypothetical protein
MKQKARNVVEKFSSSAKQFFKSTAKSAQTIAISQGKKVKEKATELTKGIAGRVSNWLKSRITSTAHYIGERLAPQKIWKVGRNAVHRSLSHVTTSATQHLDKVKTSVKTKIAEHSRSILLWGVVFVGVYGVASTLPVEIFRYLTQQRKESSNDVTKENE